ncbi:MAG: CDGSH iron-sulfur domain-containing protein [Chloroflexi bacterium]|nr:CDGSH iron-sulfur domain-containing protein [Chloroflexota bacterium]
MAKIRDYQGEGITVQYELKRCIHAEKCVHGLPTVFMRNVHPWIQPEHATADELAAVIEQCPTGALHYQRTDDGPPEAIPQENTIRMDPNGPLHVRGNVEIVSSTGSLILNDTRVALCRCGASQFKPFCDNSHIAAGFTDPGLPATNKIEDVTDGETRLVITLNQNGPIGIAGNFRILNADGEVVFQGTETWLCRCGGSQNKPFCDKTHRTNGFQAE